MRSHWLLLSAVGAAAIFPGCATNSEPTQKEKERMAREQQRMEQKQAQAEARRMREATQTGQRRIR